MPLDLPWNVICSAARFKLRVHIFCFETATWNLTSSPTCDLCEADVMYVQDEKWKTCSLSLHAPSDGFSPQEVRVIIFTDRKYLLF